MRWGSFLVGTVPDAAQIQRRAQLTLEGEKPEGRRYPTGLRLPLEKKDDRELRRS